MSHPRPLSLRLVRLAAGVAVSLSAIGLYGATGAWADKPASPGNSAAAHAATGNAANGNAAPAAASAALAGAATTSASTSAAVEQAPAPAAAHEPPGQAKKAAADAPAVAVAPVVSAAVSTPVVAAAPAAAAAKPGNSDHSNGNASTVGDPTKPQPLSNADKNPGGANNGGNCGDYCSTRDGSPSMNGNGGGKANGKPCAGCVGKADNKNPPGQFKNGSDHNAGYECDRNHGIGRGNPAHTGCTPHPSPSPSPSPSCIPTSANNMCQPPCVPTSANNMCQPPCVATAANNFCQPPCTINCGGTTTGGSTGGTTGITTGGSTGAQTTGGTTGGTTGATTGGGTGGTSGGATTGGTTGITSGGGSGAQTTGGTSCPTSAQGLVGPMPAGCHLGGDTGGGGALPFTGLDAMVLVGIGSIAAGLGLALTAAGSIRRRRQA